MCKFFTQKCVKCIINSDVTGTGVYIPVIPGTFDQHVQNSEEFRRMKSINKSSKENWGKRGKKEKREISLFIVFL